MKITLSPTASNKTSQVSVYGLVLTIDGTEYDLSAIPENGQAEAVEGSPFIGVLTRDKVTLRYEYDSQRAEPNQSTNWDDYTFECSMGVVPCPISWKPNIEEVQGLLE